MIFKFKKTDYLGQNGLVGSKLIKRLKGCEFESCLSQYTKWNGVKAMQGTIPNRAHQKKFKKDGLAF